MKLSAHFDLSEFTVSQTATRLRIDNTPSLGVIAELQRLARTVLEPLRVHYARPVVVSSGYRSPALNAAIPNSAKFSDHMAGRAADIVVPGVAVREVALAIVALGLPFKQVISEGGAWVHVSIPPDGLEPKREQLTAIFSTTGVTYVPGIL